MTIHPDMWQQRGTWKVGMKGPNRVFSIFHILGTKKYNTHFITLNDAFRWSRENLQPSEKKTGKLLFRNLIRKCGLSHSREMSLLPQLASLWESDGEINHWGIGFQSQLGRTGWTPALWNGLGGATLWIGILHGLRKALPACAVSSSWRV